MSGRKVFTAGEVLLASDLNDVVDQTVMVFAGTAARGSAIPSPTEGMVTYLADSDEVEVFDGSAYKAVGPGKILQVVQTAKTDTFSVSLGNGAFSSDVTGLTASITPSSASSKILVTVTVNGSNSGNGSALPFRLTKNTSPIFVGDSAGSRLSLTSTAFVDSANTSVSSTVTATFLDSPSTTSSTTYGIQLANPHTSTFTYYVNRTNADTDNVFFPRMASSITLMEVAG